MPYSQSPWGPAQQGVGSIYQVLQNAKLLERQRQQEQLQNAMALGQLEVQQGGLRLGQNQDRREGELHPLRKDEIIAGTGVKKAQTGLFQEETLGAQDQRALRNSLLNAIGNLAVIRSTPEEENSVARQNMVDLGARFGFGGNANSSSLSALAPALANALVTGQAASTSPGAVDLLRGNTLRPGEVQRNIVTGDTFSNAPIPVSDLPARINSGGQVLSSMQQNAHMLSQAQLDQAMKYLQFILPEVFGTPTAPSAAQPTNPQPQSSTPPFPGAVQVAPGVWRSHIP